MLLTRNETARELRISEATRDRLVREGAIKPIKVRRRVLFAAKAVQAFVRRCANKEVYHETAD